MSKYIKEELESLIIDQALSYEAIGRMYGVTGNAIKKAAKRLDIDLPKRRTINKDEVFSKPDVVRSKVDKLSDEEFKKIIETKVGWKEISIAIGYTNQVSSNIRERILERCQKLGMQPNLQVQSSVLQKTKGDLLSSRKNYQSYRSTIRKLAEKAYKESGKPLSCSICGYDKHIEIAHIKAVSDFDNSSTIAEINSINNLIALCPNHHWEYDNGVLKL